MSELTMRAREAEQCDRQWHGTQRTLQDQDNSFPAAGGPATGASQLSPPGKGHIEGDTCFPGTAHTSDQSHP